MHTSSSEATGTEAVERVLDLLSASGELYDVLRIVDPVARKVTEHVPEKASAPPYPCPGFWSDDAACHDCLSARAFRTGRRMSRVEFHNGRAWLCSAIPLRMGGRGVVVELLRNLTGILVTMGGDAIEPAELQVVLERIEQGTTLDPLTGLLDRHAADVRLPRELDRAHSTRYPLSLVLLCVDGLVRLRSRYGDDVVEEVLRTVGGLVKSSLRSEQDWVARSCDDTFLVVMRNTGHAGLQTVAERLRARVARLGIQHGDRTVSVTASLAIHVEMPTTPSDGPLLPILEKRVREAGFEGGDRIV